MILTIDSIAQLCHQRMVVINNANGDFSVPNWDFAPMWQKESTIQGIYYVIRTYPIADPEGVHENWMRCKVADGWSYGEVRDEEAKTHPCMIPYDELPKYQKLKDAVFINTVYECLGLNKPL